MNVPIHMSFYPIPCFPAKIHVIQCVLPVVPQGFSRCPQEFLIFRHVVLDVSKGVAQTSAASEKTMVKQE